VWLVFSRSCFPLHACGFPPPPASQSLWCLAWADLVTVLFLLRQRYLVCFFLPGTFFGSLTFLTTTGILRVVSVTGLGTVFPLVFSWSCPLFPSFQCEGNLSPFPRPITELIFLRCFRRGRRLFPFFLPLCFFFSFEEVPFPFSFHNHVCCLSEILVCFAHSTLLPTGDLTTFSCSLHPGHFFSISPSSL